MTDGREINTSRPLEFKRAMSVRRGDSASRNCPACRIKGAHCRGFFCPIHRDLEDP
jgi:hypothetical protein